PSAQVLGALADALRLPVDERFYLLRLTKTTGRSLCPAAQAPARSVRPTVRAVLDQLEPAPAYVVNRLTDVLAFTIGYERLAGPVGALDVEPPNLVRFVLTDPRARAVYPKWDAVVDEHVAYLKLGSSRGDHHVAELSDLLAITAGAPFTD